ncbi:MAG TPA: diguanylate cyclase, partial [Gemmata sp.]|nr:diguanylate cyclase [Gemmata sp.]
DNPGALVVAERLRESVANHQFRFESTPLNLTISIGVATTAGDLTMTPAALLKAADDNLYTAKRSGRNRVIA